MPNAIKGFAHITEYSSNFLTIIEGFTKSVIDVNKLVNG